MTDVVSNHPGLPHDLIGRLVLGAMIEVDSPEHKARAARGPDGGAALSPTPKDKGKHRDPSAWIFQLRRDVRVDARKWVREYAESGGKAAPSVRVLVRGHHKRQVCGVGRSNRKWIHVEPYWKGDDALPIAVRAHRLTKLAAPDAPDAVSNEPEELV